MENFSKYNEDFFLFLEAGFIALNQADEDSAIKLFKTCQLLQPENTLSEVAMGYMHIHKLELKKAEDVLKKVLEKEPENEMAKTFLGIALSFSSKTLDEGETLLKETAKECSDEDIKKSAKVSLDFVDRFVKQAAKKHPNQP